VYSKSVFGRDNKLQIYQSSGVTMGWLLRLVTGGPTGGWGPPTVLEFLVINFSVCFINTVQGRPQDFFQRRAIGGERGQWLGGTMASAES